MIDLENLPLPEILKLQDFPGINPQLISEQFARGPDGEKYLITLFDFIQRSKHRAETLAQIYFNQMEILHKLLANAKTSDAQSRSGPRKEPAASKKIETSLAIDL